MLCVYTASMEHTYEPEHVCHHLESQPPVGGTLGPGASLSLQIHQSGANLNADYERLLEDQLCHPCISLKTRACSEGRWRGVPWDISLDSAMFTAGFSKLFLKGENKHSKYKKTHHTSYFNQDQEGISGDRPNSPHLLCFSICCSRGLHEQMPFW